MWRSRTRWGVGTSCSSQVNHSVHRCILNYHTVQLNRVLYIIMYVCMYMTAIKVCSCVLIVLSYYEVWVSQLAG